MDARGLVVGISLLAMATAHCATPPKPEDEADEGPIEEAQLDLTVDSVDVIHGALRLRATMVDGAADVSVTLGGDCERREAGGGLSTASTLTWTLGDGDLADALGCGLAVRANVRSGGRYVSKLAQLAIAVEVTRSADGPGSESSTKAPSAQDDSLPDIPPLELAHSLLLRQIALVGASLVRGLARGQRRPARARGARVIGGHLRSRIVSSSRWKTTPYSAGTRARTSGGGHHMST